MTLPRGKKVDFLLQSSLLRVEREQLGRRLALLREWSRKEDQRWSFLSQSMKQLDAEVNESKEAAESAESAESDKNLAEVVAGLRERVSLMEATFTAHERSMEQLQASLNKSVEALMPFPSPEKKASRRRSSAM